VTKKLAFIFFPNTARLSQKHRGFSSSIADKSRRHNPFRKKTRKGMETMRPQEHNRSFTGYLTTNHLFF
jgi:hypothetical protein